MSTESLEMEDEPKATLFPTRLREFEEKNNLVFHHFLGAKGNMRRASATSYFGDQYTRRTSVDTVPPEFILENKFDVMRSIFRRTSGIDGNLRLDVLETRLIPLIFQRMGQDYNEEELRRWIKSNDPHGLGVVDFNGYQRICVHFLKDKQAIENARTEEFSFKNLIRKDSEHSSNSDLSNSE